MSKLLENVEFYHLILILGVFVLELLIATDISKRIPHICGAWELSYIVVSLIAAFIKCEYLDNTKIARLWGVIGALDWTCAAVGFVFWIKKAAANPSGVYHKTEEKWRCVTCGKLTSGTQRCEFCNAMKPLSGKQTIVHETNAATRVDEWQCVCGRIHPRYVSTCSCGTNKRDQCRGAKVETDMIFCQRCGEKCAKTMNVCPVCGQRLKW